VGRWEVLESIAVADCALEVEGETLDDLFETSARALADLMVDPETVPVSVERAVTLTAASLDLLLYDWIAELIYLKDAEQAVFTRARVEVVAGPPSGLTAWLAGGRIDPERTALRADPKAPTFHRFTLEPTAGGWRARMVIDI